jgi:translation elongation factor EF-Ts
MKNIAWRFTSSPKDFDQSVAEQLRKIDLIESTFNGAPKKNVTKIVKGKL